MSESGSYVGNLVSFREEASNALVAEYPGVKGVFGRMVSFFTEFCQRLDGVEIGDEALQYKILLAVSFMRTHICVCEHIFRSENIEAVTLMRKQLELIARMNEVDVKDLNELYDKVPNVGFSRPMNVLYGLMSKIAHNANYESLDMLGYQMDDESHKRFSVYPIYTPDTIRSFDHAIGLFVWFVIAAARIQEEIIPGYDKQAEGEALMKFFEYGKTTGIPFFESLKEGAAQ